MHIFDMRPGRICFFASENNNFIKSDGYFAIPGFKFSEKMLPAILMILVCLIILKKLIQLKIHSYLVYTLSELFSFYKARIAKVFHSINKSTKRKGNFQ